jgi:hypothetical protein
VHCIHADKTCIRHRFPMLQWHLNIMGVFE